MADTIRRVYEIDAKISTDALASLKAIQQNLKAMEDSAGKAGTAAKKVGKDAEEGGHGFEKLNFSSVGARRELLVLVHELSQGNFKQFGGSLLVLGERIDATALIMSAAGLATIGFGAAVTGIAIALAHGAIEQDKFNKSLIITNDFAGVTETSFKSLADSISESSKATISSTTGVLQAVVSSGRFGPALLEPASKAILEFSKLSGESAAEVTKDFLKLGDSAEAFAKEHNKQYHFLNADEYERVRVLEETGRLQEAQLLVLQNLNQSFGTDGVKNLGYLQSAWEGVKNAVSSAVHAVAEFGKTSDLGTQIAEAKAQAASIQALLQNPSTSRDPNARGGATGTQQDEALTTKYAQQLAKVDNLQRELQAQTNSAFLKSTRGAFDQEQEKAQQVLNTFDKQVRGAENLKLQLEKFDAAVAKRRQDGKSDSEIFPGTTVEAERNALIKKLTPAQHTDKTDTAVDARLRSLREENAAIEDQIKQYDELGKSVNASTLAKVKSDLANGKLQGASAQQAKLLLAEAATQDADNEELRNRKAIKSADDYINKLREQASAQALNSREVKEAAAVAQLNATGIQKGTIAYGNAVILVRQLTNALEDQALARKLLQQIAGTDQQIAKLNEETNLIGKNSLERQKAAAVLKIQAEAAKNLQANPENGRIINATAELQINSITAALDRAYEAQRKFESGAKTAFATYSEEAANAGKFATDTITGGLQLIQSDFFTLFTTGKFTFNNLFKYMSDSFLQQAAKVTTERIFGDKGFQGFITEGLNSLSSLLGFDFGSLKTTLDPAMAAKATETQALLQSTLALDTLNGTYAFGALSVDAMSTAANNAAFALLSLASSAGAGGSGGILSLLGGSLGIGGAGISSNVEPSLLGLSALGFANGGIMGPGGRVPLNTYAGGGIASGPQVALFGEGRRKEAYIPLPDNKTVPVTLSGGGGGATVVNIYNNGSGDDVKKKERTNSNGDQQIDIYIEKKVRSVINGDISSGGGVSKVFEGQYGLNRAVGAAR